MLKEGADIIDIGALSTRPGAKLISVKEEKLRLLPALRNIKKHFPNTILSVDTFRGSVARACIDEGIDIINDIGGLQMDEEMFDVISKNNVAYILMHGANSFNTMHKTNEDTDIFRDISLFFSRQLNKLIESGQTEVILDPGFGFGKTLDQNYTLLNQLNMLHIFGFPILVGVSRKSMIWKRLGIDSENALNGTTCLNTIALLNGASFFRVHDVREMKEIIQLTETIP
jgi:dihydropteroate synthase